MQIGNFGTPDISEREFFYTDRSILKIVKVVVVWLLAPETASS